MHRPRPVACPGEDLPHVSHELGEVHRYFRRRVVIVGGRNSAVEAAIRLYRVGADVSLSYRRAEFSRKVKYWLRPELEALIEEGRIAFFPETDVDAIDAEAVTLKRSSFSIASGDRWRKRLPADDVLLLTGYEQDPTLLEQAGVELSGPLKTPSVDSATMQTNVPGLFLAGTASAGTQASGVSVFIETSHVHAQRIAAAVLGGGGPATETEPDATTERRSPAYVHEES
jgi:thioredoxin reductase (NADPH)